MPMLEHFQLCTGVVASTSKSYLIGNNRKFTWNQVFSAAGLQNATSPPLHTINCRSTQYSSLVGGDGDGDGDGESRSGEDGGDGDGENGCDEDGGDGDGESRCGEVRPKAPSAAAAGSGEMRPARGRLLRQPRSAPRRPRTPLCGPRPRRPAPLSRGP